MANQTVEYQGNEISQYQASQIQRSLERQVRLYKREASALDAANLDNSQEMAKVRDYQEKLRDFVNQTNLSRQYAREQV